MRPRVEGQTTGVTEEDVFQAAREFAEVLAETPEYRAFEEAQRRMRQDPAAQEAIRAFQAKQQSLGWMVQLGLVGEAEQAELQRLRQAMLAQPTVRSYTEAQERLGSLCQEVAQLLSEEIGLSFAAACGPGCC